MQNGKRNGLKKKTGITLLVIAVIITVALAIFVHYHSVLKLDVFLSRDLQSEGDTPEKRTIIYHVLYYISILGKPAIAAVLILMTALTFWILRYFREAIFTLLVPIASGINFILKILVNRPRPDGNLVNVISAEFDPSFPSGHVVFYVVFFGYLIATMFFVTKIPLWLRTIIGLISLALIISVSFSRVYLGAHWVTDVIGGYLVGGVLLSILLYFYLKQKINQRH